MRTILHGKRKTRSASRSDIRVTAETKRRLVAAAEKITQVTTRTRRVTRKIGNVGKAACRNPIARGHGVTRGASFAFMCRRRVRKPVAALRRCAGHKTHDNKKRQTDDEQNSQYVPVHCAQLPFSHLGRLRTMTSHFFTSFDVSAIGSGGIFAFLPTPISASHAQT